MIKAATRACSLAELAERLGLSYKGDGSLILNRGAPLLAAEADSLTFFSPGQPLAALKATCAGAVIVEEHRVPHCPAASLSSANPRLSMAKALAILYPPPPPRPGISPKAQVAADADIDPSAEIGSGAIIGSRAQIGPHAVIEGPGRIGDHVSIGAATRLEAGVVVADGCSIGHGCIIRANTVIGSDGFGYEWDDEGRRWQPFPQVAGVVIGDGVEIGSCVAIDRGALEDTRIGNGVIIDNQVQIAHGVSIGENTAMAAQVGIAGGTSIGGGCRLGGQVGVVSGLSVCDGVELHATSAVLRDIDRPGAWSSAIQVRPARRWYLFLQRLLRPLDS